MKKTNLIKKIVTFGTVAALSTSMLAMPVIAGSFKTDEKGIWYDNGNGTYPKNEWKWIDDDGDGQANCYYFDENGYVYVGVTPDGFITGADGKWIQDGVAAVKSLASAAADTATQIASMLQGSSKASQSAVDAINGIKSTTTTSDKEVQLNITSTSTGVDVGQLVTKRHIVKTVTDGIQSSSNETEDSGPDMSKTSYETFGPSVPTGAGSTEIAPTTNTATVNVAGPDGTVDPLTEDEDKSSND